MSIYAQGKTSHNYVQSHPDMTLYTVNKHVPVIYLNKAPHNMYNHHEFGSYIYYDLHHCNFMGYKICPP